MVYCGSCTVGVGCHASSSPPRHLGLHGLQRSHRRGGARDKNTQEMLGGPDGRERALEVRGPDCGIPQHKARDSAVPDQAARVAFALPAASSPLGLYCSLAGRQARQPPCMLVECGPSLGRQAGGLNEGQAPASASASSVFSVQDRNGVRCGQMPSPVQHTWLWSEVC